MVLSTICPAAIAVHDCARACGRRLDPWNRSAWPRRNSPCQKQPTPSYRPRFLLQLILVVSGGGAGGGASPGRQQQQRTSRRRQETNQNGSAAADDDDDGADGCTEDDSHDCVIDLFLTTTTLKRLSAKSTTQIANQR